MIVLLHVRSCMRGFLIRHRVSFYLALAAVSLALELSGASVR